jgi:uncharacterized protein (DUF362 family)
MKRRDFIKLSYAAGIGGLVGPAYTSMAQSPMAGRDGFDLHPFIKEHPEAVFINPTTVQEKTDAKPIYNAAYKLASEIFIKTADGEGYTNSTRINCKPNWTCTGKPGSDPASKLGITTDLNYIEGFLNGVKGAGPQNFSLRECACPQFWESNGYTAMAERNNFDLKELSSKDYWDLESEEIIFKDVDGIVFKKVGFMAPMNAPDTFLINIAKFKTHRMGLTGAIKNLQGITGKKFHQFCGGHLSVFKSYHPRYHQFFQPDYMDRIKELQFKHELAGIPRWDSEMDRPPYGGGLFMEQWVQRMLDSYSVTPTGINIVEGIYGLDGDGFGRGPHKGKGRTFMSNQVIFGQDAFRVDIIEHWLGGHEPGNFGLFHIGMERGLSDVLDPHDIPIYLWKDGKAEKVHLDSIKRTPLLTEYLRKNTKGFDEDKYHLCDEPFDYTSWKATGEISQPEPPSIRALGTNSNNEVVMELSVPEKGEVYVDIKNRHGEVIWRMETDDLEPGKHEVVWDGFSQPGLYNTYVRGMGWDAEREMVIYT